MKNIFKDKVILGLSIALVVVVVLIVGVILFPILFNSVEALNFTNLTEKEVVDWYEDQFGNKEGLKIVYEYSETVEKGKVIKQSIKDGDKIEEEIIITISNGPDPSVEFTLPDFVKEKYDKTKIEAYFKMNKFLDVTYEYRVDKKAPKDLVIDVNKKGKVKRGDPILVTLSVGKDISILQVKVVDLTKYSLNNAEKWASANAIKLDINRIFSDKPKGTILSQNIKAETTIKGGSTIKIEVSRGKAITVNNVVGESESDAISSLKDQNLNPSVSYGYSSSVSKGYVISQNPVSGSKVEEDSTVEIIVSKGKNPKDIYVDVADMSGKTESEFIKHVNSLGLKYSKKGGYYSDSIKKGLIYSNDNGSYNMLSTIGYRLSLGSYTFNANEFNGKSLDKINSIISSYNDQKAGISFNMVSVPVDEVDLNTANSCSYANKTITCEVGHQAHIFAPSVYNRGASVNQTKEIINSLLGLWFDISFNYDENSVYSDGHIISMAVNGNTAYNPGFYEVGTSIVVTIAKN